MEWSVGRQSKVVKWRSRIRSLKSIDRSSVKSVGCCARHHCFHVEGEGECWKMEEIIENKAWLHMDERKKIRSGKSHFKQCI